MDHQLPPDGDWKTWVILGGRGAGKTRAGAEWVRAEVEGPRPLDPGRSRRVALVGETIEQAVTVMVEGESGILACSPPDRRPHWDATRKRLLWPNGGEARVYSAHDPERMRGPQFDAAWADEYGCPAVDRGTNEPNRFYDPKSSESGLPRYSSGRRDDLIQMQYLRAIADHWGQTWANPLSGVYEGAMLDLAHSYAWAWDARPYPFFPANRDAWNDGDNYRLGHWLTGRVTSRSLASVVAEICEESGLRDFDVSELHGVVSGYAPNGIDTGRARLQPLMLAYGFDAAERDGRLVFRSREVGRPRSIGQIDLAVLEGETGDFVSARGAPSDAPGRLCLSYVEADGDFEIRTTEASVADAAIRSVGRSELPLALSAREARSIAERWLAEARVGRDRVRFALPQSDLSIGAGDIVSFEPGGLYRVDAVEDAGARLFEAVRIEPGIYVPVDAADDAPALRPFVSPLPVEPVLLDLPLLTGQEDPGSPYIAITGTPWSDVAVYASGSDGEFAFERLVEQSAIMGETLVDLPAASAGLWDRGGALRVRLFSGALESTSLQAVLAGRNAMAIGDPAANLWEVFQFASADLVAPGVYDLTMRLRGQAGTDAVMPEVWPAGSRVVRMDDAVVQIRLPAALQGIERRYLVGPARRPPDDPSFKEITRSFEGIGLRPYSPARLKARQRADGGLDVSWIRRTRIEGDRWAEQEVPLGETSELYRIRVLVAGGIVRSEETSDPSWSYSLNDMASDGVTGRFEIAVAQISESFGPGPFARIEIDG